MKIFTPGHMFVWAPATVDNTIRLLNEKLIKKNFMEFIGIEMLFIKKNSVKFKS